MKKGQVTRSIFSSTLKALAIIDCVMPELCLKITADINESIPELHETGPKTQHIENR